MLQCKERPSRTSVTTQRLTMLAWHTLTIHNTKRSYRKDAVESKTTQYAVHTISTFCITYILPTDCRSYQTLMVTCKQLTPIWYNCAGCCRLVSSWQSSAQLTVICTPTTAEHGDPSCAMSPTVLCTTCSAKHQRLLVHAGYCINPMYCKNFWAG